MLIKATRTVSALTLRAGFYAGLFLVVALVHVAITSALQSSGWNAGLSLFASGAVVLAIVLILVNVADYVVERRAGAREIERMRQGLPGGPCCVIWRAAEGEADMPWRRTAPLRARYPALARRLGVEGVTVVEFEINAQGAPKNIHCVYSWPADVFYDAAHEALTRARFEPKDGAQVRFGASYRMPFIFRISGATRVKQIGQRPRKLRPAVTPAREPDEKVRRSA